MAVHTLLAVYPLSLLPLASAMIVDISEIYTDGLVANTSGSMT
jgi:hypothetical protein